MRRYIVLVAIATVTACSSTHDLKRDGMNFFGGGFIDDEVGPSLHLIKAFSNTSLLATPESAAKTFEYRAEQLCPNGYQEIRPVSGAYRSMTPGPSIPVAGKPGAAIQGPPHVISSKIGHILCNDAPITLDEARALVVIEDE